MPRFENQDVEPQAFLARQLEQVQGRKTTGWPAPYDTYLAAIHQV
jgi:hypothetical protein